MSNVFQVSVPATTANVGPGFDCLGAALTRYNKFMFSQSEKENGFLQITVDGMGASQVSTDESNLAYVAFCEFFHALKQPIPGIHLHIELDVPLARGMGSSSTAIVGGVLGANALAGFPLGIDALAQLATRIEGHPDNVVPALLGGCQLSTVDEAGRSMFCAIPWQDSIVPILVVPAFEISTAQARQVLPLQYSRSDAVYTLGHLGLLIRALETGNGEWIRVALDDRIHVPYRETLIPGYREVVDVALESGAYGVTISGAGPTLLALGSPQRANAIASAMAQAWQSLGVDIVDASPLRIDTRGSTVVSLGS